MRSPSGAAVAVAVARRRWWWWLLAAAAATPRVLGFLVEDPTDKQGLYALVLNSETLKCRRLSADEGNVSELVVYFYDFRAGASLALPAAAPAAAAGALLAFRPRLDPARPFVIYLPAHHASVASRSVARMRAAFRRLRDTYLLVVDYSRVAGAGGGGGGGAVETYERAVERAAAVGARAGELLAALAGSGSVRAAAVRGLGHGLGAHVLAAAADTFRALAGRPLSRLTALDPAGPCHAGRALRLQVRSGVAAHVEVFHCNAGALGSASVLGDVDMFANGGSLQPLCSRAAPLPPTRAHVARCSHEACVWLYAATLTHRSWYPATPCRTRAACRHRSPAALAGYWSPANLTGLYYFFTDLYLDDV